MKILLVAGARPNFMKVAPILHVLEEQQIDTVLVHTGQHYDEAMSDAFFRDLGIRDPDYSLGVGSASHALQTARMMESFEPILKREAPAWVVVVGDVNSTLAAALVACKLKEEVGCRIAHVEAGLRSHDWRMPEEVNRVLTDRLSDLLFTPSRDALPNLLAEGIPGERICFVGNVMIDSLMRNLPIARKGGILEELELVRDRYAVATLHRPGNVDDREDLVVALESLGRIAADIPLVLPLHPRTKASIARNGVHSLLEGLTVVEPLGYLDMLSLLDGAAAVLTDSGGIQEETSALGIPCVTLREDTERPITISEGTNRLAPWPLTSDGILDVFRNAMAEGRSGTGLIEGWDGRASERIVQALANGL